MARSPNWQAYKPAGPQLRFFFVGDADGSFTFTATWGEAMKAKLGDVIVQNPKKPADVYRIARTSFDCTYDVISTPRQP